MSTVSWRLGQWVETVCDCVSEMCYSVSAVVHCSPLRQPGITFGVHVKLIIS